MQHFKIQPGKPLVFAVPERGVRRALVFGLPGNPASVMVGFWLFVRPVLRLLAGHADGFWQGSLAAVLDLPTRAVQGRDRFLPATLHLMDGQLHAAPELPRGSHDIAGLARATGLLRLPAGSPPRSVGDLCQVLPLPGGPAAW